jgi:hypothetical protein
VVVIVDPVLGFLAEINPKLPPFLTLFFKVEPVAAAR